MRLWLWNYTKLFYWFQVAAMGYNIDKSKLGRYFIEWLNSCIRSSSISLLVHRISSIPHTTPAKLRLWEEKKFWYRTTEFTIARNKCQKSCNNVTEEFLWVFPPFFSRCNLNSWQLQLGIGNKFCTNLITLTPSSAKQWAKISFG